MAVDYGRSGGGASGTQAVAVLRTIWAAEGVTGADLDEDCGPTKTCRNMREVTFDGFAEPGSDLGSAWRSMLERDGKLGAGSLRDLVLGAAPAPDGASALARDDAPAAPAVGD